jgi:dihydroorotate dehydrogenase
MIAKPDISPDFTIDDIYKIREYHYELTKDMTTQERINFYNEGGRAFLAEMEKRKRQKAAANNKFLT